MPRSKRVYPKRICINPSCSKEFIPHDKRQTHCCPQCGTDKRNDNRDKLEATVYADIKLVKKADKILAKMYSRLYAENIIWLQKELLAYEQIDLTLGVKQERNSETKRQIRWFFCYGIEFHENGILFIIHKRNKNEISKNRK